MDWRWFGRWFGRWDHVSGLRMLILGDRQLARIFILNFRQMFSFLMPPSNATTTSHDEKIVGASSQQPTRCAFLVVEGWVVHGRRGKSERWWLAEIEK